MSILVLRHFKTHENVSNIYMGQLDCHIMPGNHRVDLNGNLLSKSIVIFHSTLFRCVETVWLFRNQYQELSNDNACSIETYPTPDLIERGLGDFEGKNKDCIKSRFPHAFMNNKLDPCFNPPNGETFVEFNVRVCRFYSEILDYIRSNKNKQVIVCSHMQVLRLLYYIHNNINDNNERWSEINFVNGMLTTI